MKTNQNLIRKMGEFDVIQRTSDGMFNATTLLKAWNASGAGSRKEMGDYFATKSTDEYINALLSESEFTDGNSPYVKSRASRGENAGTWMHPLLFIDFAMWLNPTFKVKVLRFVYDQLIQYRNDAGDSYKEMASAICKIVPKGEQAKAIKEISMANNHIIYGTHEREIRNKQAEEGKIKQLDELQTDITKLISDGFICNYSSLLNYLRRKWTQKYQPKFITTQV